MERYRYVVVSIEKVSGRNNVGHLLTLYRSSMRSFCDVQTLYYNYSKTFCKKKIGECCFWRNINVGGVRNFWDKVEVSTYSSHPCGSFFYYSPYLIKLNSLRKLCVRVFYFTVLSFTLFSWQLPVAQRNYHFRCSSIWI